MQPPQSSSSLDVVFSFDNTASMNQCIREVRRRVKQIVHDLFSSIPGVRIGIIAHGDYGSPAYTIRSCDLTADMGALVDFVTHQAIDAPNQSDDECYELVLRDCQLMSWRADSVRRLVLIGDCCPHEVGDRENVLNIDWREELVRLRAMDVVVYAVHCLEWSPRERYAMFYAAVARETGGLYLKLNSFASVPTLLQGVCHLHGGNPGGLERFEQSLETDGGGRTREVTRLFDTLLGRAPTPLTPSALQLAPEGKYQMLPVDADEDGTPIRDFVQHHNLPFLNGSGYYKLARRERISNSKCILLRHRVLGDVYEGDSARAYATQHVGGEDLSALNADSIPEFDVFVQSKSVSRKLKGGTLFIYSVDRV
jgi:hypothetical protein